VCPKIYKAYFLTKHFYTQNLYFINLDIFRSVVNFRDVIFELFRSLNFCKNILANMLLGKDWNDSFFQSELKSFFHLDIKDIIIILAKKGIIIKAKSKRHLINL